MDRWLLLKPPRPETLVLPFYALYLRGVLLWPLSLTVSMPESFRSLFWLLRRLEPSEIFLCLTFIVTATCRCSAQASCRLDRFRPDRTQNPWSYHQFDFDFRCAWIILSQNHFNWSPPGQWSGGYRDRLDNAGSLHYRNVAVSIRGFLGILNQFPGLLG